MPGMTSLKITIVRRLINQCEKYIWSGVSCRMFRKLGAITLLDVPKCMRLQLSHLQTFHCNDAY